jgi:hypothetical protein
LKADIFFGILYIKPLAGGQIPVISPEGLESALLPVPFVGLDDNSVALMGVLVLVVQPEIVAST